MYSPRRKFTLTAITQEPAEIAGATLQPPAQAGPGGKDGTRKTPGGRPYRSPGAGHDVGAAGRVDRRGDPEAESLVKETLRAYLGENYQLVEAKGWKSLPTRRMF